MSDEFQIIQKKYEAKRIYSITGVKQYKDDLSNGLYCDCIDKVETIKRYYSNLYIKKLLIGLINDLRDIIMSYFDQPGDCQKCIEDVDSVSSNGTILTYIQRDPPKYYQNIRILYKVIFLCGQQNLSFEQTKVLKISENNREQIIQAREPQIVITEHRSKIKEINDQKKITKNQRSKKLFKKNREKNKILQNEIDNYYHQNYSRECKCVWCDCQNCYCEHPCCYCNSV